MDRGMTKPDILIDYNINLYNIILLIDLYITFIIDIYIKYKYNYGHD